MPSTAKPNRGGWLLRSKTTRPAFSRCRPAATVRRAALSLRIWSGTASLLLAVHRPQARFGEGLHRTRRFHLAVLNRRSASLWPTTNRWFFGKASTRSSRLLHRTGHQLTMPLRGSATLPLKNNRESYSCSKAGGRLKIAASRTLAPTVCSPLA